MALACLGVIGCSHEDTYDETCYQPGDDVVFNVKAVVEPGNEESKQSRTIYGDINADKNQIELKWVEGDQLDIACLEAEGNKLATYQIPGNANGKPVAETLECESPLKWGQADIHDFYAIYPSAKVFKNYSLEEQPTFEIDLENKIAKGFMPKSYTVKDSLITIVGEEGKRVYTITPNMDFAYMVAKQSIKISNSNQNGGISLSFAPLATAIEFEIKADDIGTKETDEIIIDRVEFIAKQTIVGGFTYDFQTGVLANTSSSIKSTKSNIVTLRQNRLSFDIDAVDYEKNIRMVKGDVCNITAFIIPDHDITPSTMEVKIWYRQGIFPESKAAYLKSGIKRSHKYYFKNLKLPDIHTSDKPLLNGWFYIKHEMSDLFFSRDENGKPILVERTESELSDNDKWHLESSNKQGYTTFLIGSNNEWGNPLYLKIERGNFDPTQNNCPLTQVSQWSDTFDYFKLYASRLKPNKVTYEIMYDHTANKNQTDGKEEIFKNKCVKYFKDNTTYPLGLGLRGDENNVVILVATEAPKK